MLQTVVNAFKVKEIRKRILFTFFILVIARLGCQIPIPGTDSTVIESVMSGISTGAFSFLDAMTGSSFSTMSIFALNITTYITASIIIQLLTIAIPRLEEMQKDGETGRKKIQKITRYLTIILAVVEGLAYSIGFGNQGVFGDVSAMGTGQYVWTIIVSVFVMTAGAVVCMWLGERITEKGIGNGISMILLFNIISGMPGTFYGLYRDFIAGKDMGPKILAIVIIAAVVIAVIVFIVYLQGGERRISVQYAKKVIGRKTMGGQNTHIPIKVNTSGVIPVIFASSLLQFPPLIASFVSDNPGSWVNFFNSKYWVNPDYPIYSLGLIAYILLVVFFAYFYTSITFNPMEVANNMKKQGGFIPGIRPGKPTQDYITTILNRIIFIGAIGLLIVALIPIAVSGWFGASLSFGGTSIIIIVGVVVETLKQVESMMLVRNYKGFLND